MPEKIRKFVQSCEKILENAEKAMIKLEEKETVSENTEEAMTEVDESETVSENLDYRNIPDQHIVMTTDKRFECQLCGKVYTIKQSAWNHVETHLNGIAYNCTICDKSFKTRNHFSVHKSRSHRK